MSASSKQVNSFGGARQIGSAAAWRTGRNGGPVLRRFSNDRSGSVALIFALAIVPLTAFVGLAVDYGRAYSVNTKTQAALDAAALAAGRVAQVEKTDSVNKAAAAASAFFNQAKPTNATVSSFVFTPNAANTEFTVTATTWVKTPFLGVLKTWFPQGADPDAPASCNSYSCVKMITTATAKVTIGGSQASNVEIALMLDVTGSMAGQKLADLKAAAKDLIDVVILDNQSQYTSRVALAPFADAVRPGPFLQQVRGLPPATNRFRDKQGRWQIYKLTDCVSERDGQAAYTDAAPIGNDKLGPVYTKSGSCNPQSQVVPLTQDKVLLKGTVDRLTAGGWTAGHLGTAWAWYLISPNWGSVWPNESAPAPYGDKSTRKIAILMTDGEYNLQYDASGIATRDNGAGAMNGLSDAQARQVCANIKAAGIEVFTVGFDLHEAKAIETLRRCATDESHFYLAENGDQLRQAYRDIALKISILRLTN
ncbi:MAG: VWA domain-containing protein [Hyphomicrobiaceae bacterium]|nr:MAG: VWA domain-containing protein [Hyphomicrobiaceae bacterium]